jgi:hypothetical protein
VHLHMPRIAFSISFFLSRRVRLSSSHVQDLLVRNDEWSGGMWRHSRERRVHVTPTFCCAIHVAIYSPWPHVDTSRITFSLENVCIFS